MTKHTKPNIEAVDSALDAIPDPPTRGEIIAHEMACAGFIRVDNKDALSRHYAEFVKTYVDSSGAAGRVTAILRKDDAGIEPQGLEGFVMTIQKQVRAVPEEVHDGSWRFCRDDLLHIIDAVGASDEPTAESHLVMTQCENCKVNSIDTIKLGKKSLCKDCAARLI